MVKKNYGCRLAPTDHWENCEDIVFTQLCVECGVPGVNHSNANLFPINMERVYNITYSRAVFQVPVLNLEPGVPKIGKEFNRNLHLEIPESCYFLIGKIKYNIMRRQRFAIEKFREFVVR